MMDISPRSGSGHPIHTTRVRRSEAVTQRRWLASMMVLRRLLPLLLLSLTLSLVCWASSPAQARPFRIDGQGSGQVAVNGSIKTLPYIADYPRGTVLILTAVPDTCWQFSQWSGDAQGTENPITVTIENPTYITVEFVQAQYALELTGDSGGVIQVDGSVVELPWSGEFDCGSMVTLQAVPDDCYSFTGWSGAASGVTNPITVTMDEARSVTAHFEQENYYLVIFGVGEGEVLVDGTPQTLPWFTAYPCGTTVTVEASPAACQQFSGWFGDYEGLDNPIQVTMDGSQFISAVFEPIQYTLQLTGSDGALVSVNGQTHALPWSGTFECDAEVSLAAIDDPCHIFNGWQGDVSGSENPVSIIMDSDKSVSVELTTPTYTLNLDATGEGQVEVDGELQSLPWSGTFDCGSVVTIRAVPDDCREFASWSGDLSGTVPTRLLLLDADKTVTLNFIQPSYTLAIAGEGEGTVVVNGETQPLPYTGSFSCGSIVTVAADPADCWNLQGWSGDLTGTDNPVQLTMDSDLSLTATFAQIPYTLAIAGEGEGTVVVNGETQSLPYSGSFSCGSAVTVAADHADCWDFQGWSGDLTGADNPVQLTMDSNVSLTATFAQIPYTLAIVGEGEGTVIVNGEAQSLPYSGTFSCGSTVTVAADPAACWSFQGWSGDLTGADNPAQLTIDSDLSLTATFAQIPYTLTIAGEGEGAIVVNGEAQSLPYTGSFSCGSAVTMAADPAACWDFQGWSGDLTGADNPVQLTLDSDLSLTATFAQASYTLTIAGEGEGTVVVNGETQSLPYTSSFSCGSAVTVAADPAACWDFQGWSGDLTGADNPVQLTLDSDLSLTATFAERQYELSLGGNGGSVLVNGDLVELPWSGLFACGESVKLEAQPVEGGAFYGWMGDATGLENPILAVMDSDLSIWASFTPDEHLLLVLGNGSGTITADGVERELPWEQYLPDGISVTLRALPQPGWRFVEWTGDASGTDTQCVVTMAGPKTVTANFAEVVFSDVPEDYWAYEAIMACVHAGIVEGFPDGTYLPELVVKRDAMAVYISRACAGGDNNVPDPTVSPTFADVDSSHWAFRYVEYAAARYIVQGYPDGTYQPEIDVARSQMAVYISRSISELDENGGLVGYTPPETPAFPDVPTDYWAYPNIEFLYEHGTVTGYQDGLYHPAILVTRAQMAVFVARAFSLFDVE